MVRTLNIMWWICLWFIPDAMNNILIRYLKNKIMYTQITQLVPLTIRRRHSVKADSTLIAAFC